LKHSQSFAKEISPTGEGVNHIVKRGEVELLDAYALREASEAYTRNSIAENKVPGTENTFLWNGNVYDSGT
jgi:hypothetical protein